MHPRPPKSAPGRLKSRKAPVMKEIEEWVVGEGDVSRDTIRHASQLAENVTEERLLHSKLIELGKERYKFLHKYTYERQSFMDKQRKKFTMFKKKRVNSAFSDISRPPTRSILSTKSGSAVSRDTNMVHQTPQLRSLSAFVRPKMVQFQGSRLQSGYISTAPDTNRPRTVPADGALNRVMITSIPEDAAVINNFSNITSLTDNTVDWSRPSTGKVATFGRSISSADPLKLARDRRFSKFGSKFPGLTEEPRFAELEKSLSPNYESIVKPDVKRIIDKIESLKRPTKRLGSKEAKRELEIKIREFMAENGIVF